jgi:hypothetical protein
LHPELLLLWLLPGGIGVGVVVLGRLVELGLGGLGGLVGLLIVQEFAMACPPSNS